MLAPTAGDVIPGGGGLRKLRWPVRGHGKRGGARVIYWRDTAGERIYLIYAYLKSECSDLTPKQTATLASLIRDIKHG